MSCPATRLFLLALALSLLGAAPGSYGAASYQTSADARASYQQAQSRENSARVRSAQLRAQLSRARQRAGQIQSEGPRGLREIDAKIADLRSKIPALIAEKLDTLQEMAQGLFCSGCMQTRSQILAKGEEFPHSGQHIVPATPEMLAQKEAEFDQKISDAKRELDDLQRQRNQLIDAYNKELAAAQQPIAALERDLTDAEREASSAASEAFRARGEMSFLEQKERFAEAGRRRQDEERKKKELEEKKKQAREASLAAARFAAERDRIDREISWRQRQRELAETMQRADEATQRLRDLQDAQQRRNAADQRLAEARAEQTRQEAAAQQVAQRLAPAAPPTSTAARPDSRTPDVTDALEDSRKLADALDQKDSLGMPSQARELLDGLKDRMLDRGGKMLDNAADVGREILKLGGEAAKDELRARIEETLEEAKDRFRDDIKGLAPEAVEQAMKLWNGSGKTPDQLFTNATRDALQSANDKLFGRLTENSAALRKLSDEGISAATTYITDKAKERVYGYLNQKIFGLEDKSRSNDPIDRAETEVNNAISPVNLWMKTGVGFLRIPSMKGYYDYMKESMDKTFKYMDLVADRLWRPEVDDRPD